MEIGEIYIPDLTSAGRHSNLGYKLI